jgi:hypothetical protein
VDTSRVTMMGTESRLVMASVTGFFFLEHADNINSITIVAKTIVMP